MTRILHRHGLPAAQIERRPDSVPIGAVLDRLFAGPSKPRARITPPQAERRIAAPQVARALSLKPGSWNADARTIDVVWTTGARGVRLNLDTFDLVDEELATTPASVRLDRLNSGAPVLDTHQTDSVGCQIGVVVPGTARMVNGEGVATLQLSGRDDVAPIVADIAAGIIRNLSVGYTVHTFEVDPTASPRPLYRAIDWEPTEISFVAVPFDTGAQVRTAPAAGTCLIRTITSQETKNMSTSWMSRFTRGLAQKPLPAPAIVPAEGEDDVQEPSYQRQASITWLRAYVPMMTQMGMPEHLCSDLVLEIAERSLTEGQARDAIVQIAGERQRHATSGMSDGGAPAARIDQTRAGNALIFGERTLDNPTFRGDAVGEALYARLSGKAPPEHARQFMGMSMIDLASDMLERHGVRTRGMPATDIIEAASWNRVGARASYMQSATRGFGPGNATSDFPDLLQGAGQRFLLDVFAAAASPLKQVARQRTANDFRSITGIQVSGFGTLPRVQENGEIKHGGFVDRAESYKLESFAKIFSLTREAIINDDLGAFSNSTQFMARAAAETEAQILAGLIIANPVMRDGHPLFDAAHGNYVADGGAPSFAALDAARLEMRGQKDLDGVTPLATAPKFILSGPQRETVIEQLVAGIINPTEIGGVNPFAGKLAPLVDPRLGGPAWYLFADPNLSPVLEYAYLSGHEGPQMDTREGWNTLGTEFRVYMDFGAGVIDARGGYKNSGTPAG